MNKKQRKINIFILGGNGFLGNAFCEFCKKNNIKFRSINKKNYANFIGKKCDIFINANGNSRKYLFNKDKFLDFKLNVESVYKTFKDFRFSKYVYLSTSDIYGSKINAVNSDEKIKINIKSLSGYAFHKYISEILVKYFCEKWVIFRLNGFVGKHLKKNLVFDLLHNIPLFVRPDSKIQFMNSFKLPEYVFKVVNKDKNFNKIYNLSGTGYVNFLNIIKKNNIKYKLRKNAQKIKHLMKLKLIKKLVNLPDSHRQCEEFISKNIIKSK